MTRAYFFKIFSFFLIIALLSSSFWSTLNSLSMTIKASLPPTSTATPSEPEAQALTALGATLIYNAEGQATFINFKDPNKSIPRPGFVGANASPEAAARGFLQTYSSVFGLKNQARDLKVMK